VSYDALGGNGQDCNGTGDHARAKGVENRMTGWGKALFEVPFPTREGQTVYRNLIDAAEAGEPYAVTLGSTDPRILVQPWEMLRDRGGPLAFQGITIRRQLKGSDRRRKSLGQAVKAPAVGA
jgi:hypothetical protein